MSQRRGFILGEQLFFLLRLWFQWRPYSLFSAWVCTSTRWWVVLWQVWLHPVITAKPRPLSRLLLIHFFYVTLLYAFWPHSFLALNELHMLPHMSHMSERIAHRDEVRAMFVTYNNSRTTALIPIIRKSAMSLFHHFVCHYCHYFISALNFSACQQRRKPSGKVNCHYVLCTSSLASSIS